MEPTNSSQNKGKKIALWLTVTILVACAGFGWFMYYQANQNNSQLNKSLNDIKTKQQKDQETIKDLRTKISDSIKSEDIEESDAEQIKKVLLAYDTLPPTMNGKEDQTVVSGIKIQGNYASAGVGHKNGPGYGALLMKSSLNNQWMVIDTGQQRPEQSVIDYFSIPQEVYQS